MGKLNVSDQVQMKGFSGDAEPGSRMYIYQVQKDALVPLFRDPGLTELLAQPQVANESGRFALCYLMDGRYRVVIRDAADRTVLGQGVVYVGNGADGCPAREFPDAACLRSDQSLSYIEGAGLQKIDAGMTVRLSDSGCIFRVEQADTLSCHVRTLGGVALTIVGGHWWASAFGVVADSDASGSVGTDNAEALGRLSAALAAATSAITVTFPPGVMRSSAVFNVESAAVGNIHVLGYGSRIVFTHPAPEMFRRYFSVRHTAGNGGRCVVQGIELDLARNPVRTGGSDMLSIGGFKDVSVADVVIPSADNMGIAIDRGIVTEPNSVRICGNRIGGKAPVTGTTHDHGSIGDTGIWVQHAGYSTIISQNTITGTGDDAIAIAETSVSPAYAPAVVSGNVVSKCQGTAYKSGAAYTIFSDNYAENTRNDMFRVIDLSTGSGTTVPSGFQIVGGFGREIGMATAESLGVEHTLPATHRCGVHLQDIHGGGSIVGLRLVRTAQDAVKVTTSSRSFSGLEIRSCTFEQIGEADHAVFKREGSASSHSLTGLLFSGNTIKDTSARLIAWQCRLVSGTEGNIDWLGNEIRQCDFSACKSVFAFSGDQTQNLRNMRMVGDRWHDVVGPNTMVVDIEDAAPEHVVCHFDHEGAFTNIPTSGVRVRNNNNPGAIGVSMESRIKRGCRKTIPGSREFNADNVLITLDPAHSWEIEARAMRNSVASYDAVFYRARWDATYQRVIHETSGLGGPNGDCGLELQCVTPALAADQVFSGSDVLQLQGAVTGWTGSGGASDDPLVNFEVRWRQILDQGTQIKTA